MHHLRKVKQERKDGGITLPQRSDGLSFCMQYCVQHFWLNYNTPVSTVCYRLCDEGASGNPSERKSLRMSTSIRGESEMSCKVEDIS